MANSTPDSYKTSPFPGVETLWQCFMRSRKTFPDLPFLGTRDKSQEGAPYVWKNWTEVEELVNALSAGFTALDMMPTITDEGESWKFMGIYAKNREEWAMTQLATNRQSGTVIAFYDTLGPSAVEFVIRQTKLTTISCALQSLRSLIMLKSQGRADSVQNLVCFDEIDDDIKSDAKEAGLKLYSFMEVIAAGRDSPQSEFDEPTKDTVALFCYTSGTTGDPKAAKITHHNLVSCAAAGVDGPFPVSENDCMISYLPLAHSFEQVLFGACLVMGCKVGYFGGDVLKLTDDCQVLQPTLFPSVPRLYNRIYDKIQSRLSDLSSMKQRLARHAIATKLYYYEHYGTYTSAVYDRLVCNKFRAILGGNVRLMCTGSAPISAEVLSLLKVCFGCPILEGYGQTESTAASCVSLPLDNKSGHVGGPMPCIKIRLRDLPEMGYTAADEPYPRGEVMFKGPSVFAGYFKNPEKNAEAFVDGWLASGDVGVILPNGAVKIIDRAKNIFKLAQGEYIAPEKLENVYVQSPFVQQIHVHGDSLQSYLVAIIVPELSEIKKKLAEPAEEGGEPTKVTLSDEEILTDPSVTKLILDDMNALAKANKFNGLERVKKLYLTGEPFTVENDLLTPSMKLKRNKSAAHYRA